MLVQEQNEGWNEGQESNLVIGYRFEEANWFEFWQCNHHCPNAQIDERGERLINMPHGKESQCAVPGAV